MSRRVAALATVALVTVLAASCRNDPQTADERRRVGDDWIRKMDDRLGHATGVSVSIRGTRQRIREGQTTTVPFTIDLVMRSSGGMHARQVADGRATEAWYDGKALTLLSEADRTVQESHDAGSPDAALARMGEAFDLSPALTALFSSVPYSTVLADGSTGGWKGRETVGDVLSERLAYQHPTRDVALWIASGGDPLPQRIVITRREPSGQVTSDVSFSHWNLAPDLADEVFSPKVPDGYQRMAPPAPAGS